MARDDVIRCPNVGKKYGVKPRAYGRLRPKALTVLIEFNDERRVIQLCRACHIVQQTHVKHAVFRAKLYSVIKTCCRSYFKEVFVSGHDVRSGEWRAGVHSFSEAI